MTVYTKVLIISNLSTCYIFLFTMKAVILSRVSSKEQEEGKSIDAQKDNLEVYCKRKELPILKVFKIVESSTRGDRKRFYEMIDYIKKQKGKIALVADAVDRVQRSFKETVLIDELRKKGKLEAHFLRENIVIHENSQGRDILLWHHAVLTATSYVLCISDNVKRTNAYKIKHGQHTGPAPLGYLNFFNEETQENDIHPDPARRYLVRRIFELYAMGSYSALAVFKMIRDEGLTSKKGNPVSKNTVYDTLEDPFYYGMMKIKGELYSHKYEPLIDKWLFDKCQEVRLHKKKTPSKYNTKPLLFRGLIECAHCGCRVSADIKKNKYVYLCCTKSKGNCEGIRVKEEALLEQVQDMFHKLALPRVNL